MIVWVVGLHRGEMIISNQIHFYAWELIGIFPSEDEALKVCRTNLHYLGPVELGKDMGDSSNDEWIGAYYPKANQ